MIARRFLNICLTMAFAIVPLGGITQPVDPSPEAISQPITSKGSDGTLQFEAQGHLLGFGSEDVILAAPDHMLRIQFIGVSGALPISQGDPHDGTGFEQVTYHDLWEGISLTYESTDQGVMKSVYHLSLAPGGGLPIGQIRLRYNVPVQFQADGSLLFPYESGALHESAPLAWQEIDGQRVYVKAAYRLLNKFEVGFSVNGYDAAYPLVIDPVFTWLNFHSGYEWEHGRDIEVDSNGNVYLVGESFSGWGTPLNNHTGINDVFVAKLNSSGVLQWHTFLGSTSFDIGAGITVDGGGNIYVTGASAQTWGSPKNAHAGFFDAFVAKLNNNGTLQWNTFLGSSDFDIGDGVAVDNFGNVYIAGRSNATWGTPLNPFQGDDDAFAAKLDSNAALIWSIFLGSPREDYAGGITVDGSQNVYVCGISDYPWGSPLSHWAGGWDGFVVKLNTNGGAFWLTFMGSSQDDHIWDIDADSSGNTYIAGSSDASWGSPLNAHVGEDDAFLTRLSTNGIRLWHTFMGSEKGDYAEGVAVDDSGTIYLAGSSDESWGSPLNAHAGVMNGFLAKFNHRGAKEWHTFSGSGYYDYFSRVAVYGSGNPHVTGTAYASWGSPILAFNGGSDTIGAEYSTSGARVWNTFLGSASNSYMHDLSVNASGISAITGYVYNTSNVTSAPEAIDYDFFYHAYETDGSLKAGIGIFSPGNKYGHAITITDAGDVYIIGVCDTPIPFKNPPVNGHSGGTDAIILKYGDSGLVWHTYLGSSVADEGHGITVDVSGNVYVVGKSSATWGFPINLFQGGEDAFAAKLNSSGGLVWNMFLGSPFSDDGTDIALDGFNNVYILGHSNYPWGSPWTSWQGGWDGFVAKTNSTGTPLWLTFMGSSTDDFAWGIEADSAGNAYVVGTSYDSWGFPVNGFVASKDAFAAKIYPGGIRHWNTFMGASSDDEARDITLDGDGNLYIAGSSQHSWGTPIWSHLLGSDAFTAKLTNSGGLIWNIFLGSNENDYGEGVGIDAQKNVYVGGTSYGPWGSPIDPFSGEFNAFTVKISPSGVYLPIVIR